MCDVIWEVGINSVPFLPEAHRNVQSRHWSSDSDAFLVGPESRKHVFIAIAFYQSSLPFLSLNTKLYKLYALY